MIASKEWDVKSETVLELGAGAGLPSIVAGLCGAKEVSIPSAWLGLQLIVSTGRDIRLPCSGTPLQHICECEA